MNRIDRLSKIAQDEFGVTIKLKSPTGETFESLYDETISIDRDEKQIEELSKIIDKSPWKVEQDATGCHINSYEIAEYLYNSFCHKQVDITKKIFDDIEKMLKDQEVVTENQRCKEVGDWLLHDYLLRKLAELKKKYTEESENDR